MISENNCKDIPDFVEETKEPDIDEEFLTWLKLYEPDDEQERKRFNDLYNYIKSLRTKLAKTQAFLAVEQYDNRIKAKALERNKSIVAAVELLAATKDEDCLSKGEILKSFRELIAERASLDKEAV